MLLFSALLISLVLSSSSAFRIKSGTEIQRRVIEVDPDGRYSVGFEIDLIASSISIDVTVQTTGFVGFGISNGGGMDGSDIVIGGLHPNGTSYFKDYHGIVGSPENDDIQNWDLLEAVENSTHTYLHFSRLLDTLDVVGDVPITDTLTNIIWAIGPTDRILYHGPNRGNYSLNFFDP